MNGLNSTLFSTLSFPSLFPPSLCFHVLLFQLYYFYLCAMLCPGSPRLLNSQNHDGNKVREMNAKTSLWSYLLPHPGSN